MTDAEWGAWFGGVMAGISAPPSSINDDTLWAWSSAEGGRIHMNPLNTTEPMPNATAWNTLGGGLHVWTYATVQDAITATVATLLNGDYPLIVAHLRGSVPRQQWGDACGELGTWGTGCAWLDVDYGSPPAFGAAGGSITGGIDLLPDESARLTFLSNIFGYGRPDQASIDFLGYFRNLQMQVDDIQGKASQAAAAPAVLDAIAAVKGQVDKLVTALTPAPSSPTGQDQIGA